MDNVAVALAALVGIAVGVGVGFLARNRLASQELKFAHEKAARIVADARTQQKDLILEAKEEKIRLQREAEDDARERRGELTNLERRLHARDEQLDQRSDMLEQRDRKLLEKQIELDKSREELEKLNQERIAALEKVSSLSAEDAKSMLLEAIRAEAERDAVKLARSIERQAREEATEKARDIILTAMQRVAADHTAEHTVTVVHLPNDEMKGRIIGREGRNIRALEQATGVDLIVDDTPGAIILSGFDPYRREIAKQSIERLIADGRIHPARIEEVVEKVKTEMEESVRKDGEAAAFELGMHDLHPELQKLMGRLKYRTSYGQNVLNHSKEVAYLAGIMAKEVGLNSTVAVRAAFLHDCGKAINRKLEGTHFQIGIDLLRKHGESEAVVMAMAANHMYIDWPSLEAMIVQSADAISAARPGARRDILESYVKRLEKLEEIADSFKGVSKAFALQAGREIRIMVESERISDEETVWLSKDIARRIENELEYPGQIKVTVIRETRAVEFAR